MAGSAAQGMAKVKLGLEALQAALPLLPMGGEIHNDVMKAVSTISKHLNTGGGDAGGGQIQQLLDMIRMAKSQGGPPMASPGGGGAPPPMMPGAPPPPPPPAMLGA